MKLLSIWHAGAAHNQVIVGQPISGKVHHSRQALTTGCGAGFLGRRFTGGSRRPIGRLLRVASLPLHRQAPQRPVMDNEGPTSTIRALGTWNLKRIDEVRRSDSTASN